MNKIIYLLAFISSLAFGTDRVIINPENNGDLKIKANIAGTATDVFTITGSNGLLTIGESGETGSHTVNGGLSIAGPTKTASGVFAMTGGAVNLWDLSSLSNGAAVTFICARAAGSGTKGYAIANMDAASANVSQIVTSGVTFSSTGRVIQATGTNGHNLNCAYSIIQ